ncbi:MAG TPA: hypothetical protein VK961_25570 [Chthoniobacter sp.]|nr:hypothetical protein [Chthoniobacter sp.]
MSEFTKTFLRDGGDDAEGSAEFFGVFGKHPGWDDHIEDLPLPTASIVAAKQLLYVQGIGSQISSGAWARLSPDASLPEFNHYLLWVRGRQFLAGRLWASRDGKRRAHFPMIALIHALNLPLESALGPLMTKLDAVAAGCRATTSAEKVRNVISRVSSEAPISADQPTENSAVTLSVTPSSVRGLVRDLRGNLPPRCRLPADPNDSLRSLRFWSRICTSLASPDLPFVFLVSPGAPWIDLLSREPAPGYFFCLRAGLSALPYTYPPTPHEPVEEVDADEQIKADLGGKASTGRSWFSRMLGN